MKTDTLKKSLLDYAIKGKLTARFRRENNGLNAFDEISTYNEAIKEKRKNLEKELKKCEKELKLEKDKDKKAFFKSQIQSLKKEIVKCKEITPLNLSEAPFTIPNSWAWVKLGDICEIISGEITDLQEENLPLLDVKYLRSKGDKKLANSGNFANVNDRLILMDGENSGEIFITKEKGFLGSTLKKLEFSSLSQVEFMDFMLLCYKDFFKGNKKGAAIPHLDRKLFTNLSIPLPPLCEQQEIVKKLDLLVTLANDFAITKENLKRIEKRIEKSLLKLALEGSLSKLYRRSSPTLSAFDEINTYNEAIKEKRKNLEKELKKCEKELKLEKDKDKKALFKSQIQMLKKELTKCKEITPLFCHTEPLGEVSNNTESTTSIIAKRKGVYPLPAPLNPEKNKAAAVSKEASLSFRQSRGEPRLSASSTQAEAGHYCPPFSAFAHHEAGESEAPFTIPNSWAWVKLGDICEIQSGGTPDTQNPKYWACHTEPLGEVSNNTESKRDFSPTAQNDREKAYYWATLVDTKEKYLYKTQRKITQEGLKSSNAVLLPINSILFSSRASIGEVCIAKVETATNQGYKNFICDERILFYEYLYFALQNFTQQITQQAQGTTYKEITKTQLENFTIPLPPLCEQEYIVQTLDTLFTLKKGLRVE